MKKKVDLKYSLKHENKLSNILQKMSLNLFNNKENDFEEIYKKASILLLDFTINTQEKYKKFDKNRDKEKHIEIVKAQLNKMKSYASAQAKWIEKNRDKENLKKKVLRQSQLKARNFKGDLYASFLKEIVSKDSDSFVWNTVGDDRVRPEHDDRDQEVFTWKDADIVPGEEAMCRCWATVYLKSERINY